MLLPLLHGAWLLPVYYLVLFVPLIFYSKLVGQPAWVLITADSLAWANLADSPAVGYQFTEMRAYRSDWSKNDIKLTIYPKEGEKATISGRLHKEFWTMEEAFKEAIRRYNQANLGAEVVQEPSALTQFFTSSLSTRVLWGLLALSVSWVGWGIYRGLPSAAYLPLFLIGLPYLLIWANFYYERS
ncbi:hypothetical protein [Hymenobacter psoromatis]|uniref:hypothetical protein n=1 Tax=Hymenobacter psoromatis TaxID=1484116 RepID=UPI001CBAD2CC|nr:hypothetical protein [Hymenobacter psoromatis]